MRRRALLTTTATSLPAIVVGCTGLGGRDASNAAAEAPTARLELTTIADAKLPAKELYTIRPAETDNARARLFDQILDGGATMKATRPPLPEQRHAQGTGLTAAAAAADYCRQLGDADE